MEKAVLISIQREHNANIESGRKGAELRTMPPNLTPPFKVYTYESGIDGRHKVTNEWVCRSMTTWLMYMGLPAHLSKVACVSNEYVWQYSARGKKNITEMRISDLVVYDEPKDLSDFKPWNRKECYYSDLGLAKRECSKCHDCYVKRPPQSWMYVEEVSDE